MELTSQALGTGKISSLFRQIFYPTLLGMLSVSAVTVIDGIFVGHGVGADGIAAVNICVPLLMIVSGAALMLGTGCSVTASICLAKGNRVLARTAVSQAILTGLIFSAVLMSIIFIFPSWLARLLGSSEHLLPMVKDYLIWYAPGMLFDVMIIMSSFIVRLDGAPKLAMVSSILCALINFVLDYIFIFPLGWGVKGAAFASSICCLVGAAIQMYYLLWKAKDTRLIRLRLGLKRIKLYLHSLASQCKLGFTALIGELTMAFAMFLGNITFMKYLGDDGVGAFGIVCYYLPFVFMVGNTIAQSAQPIISYNYGLGDMDRVHTAFKVSLRTAIGCSLISTAAFVLIPKLLVGLFLPIEENAAQIAIHGFPIFSVSFVFFISNLAVIGYYQSIERVRRATVYALLRGVIFLLPTFLIMPMLLDVNGIWLTLAVSEALTFLVILLGGGLKPVSK